METNQNRKIAIRPYLKKVWGRAREIEAGEWLAARLGGDLVPTLLVLAALCVVFGYGVVTEQFRFDVIAIIGALIISLLFRMGFCICRAAATIDAEHDPPQSDTDPSMGLSDKVQVDTLPSKEVIGRIKVSHDGRRSVRDCCVKIVEFVPESHNAPDALKCACIQIANTKLRAKNSKAYIFEIHSGDYEQIDIVSKSPSEAFCRLHHEINKPSYQQIPEGSYRISIQCSGHNAKPAKATFQLVFADGKFELTPIPQSSSCTPVPPPQSTS